MLHNESIRIGKADRRTVRRSGGWQKRMGGTNGQNGRNDGHGPKEDTFSLFFFAKTYDNLGQTKAKIVFLS